MEEFTSSQQRIRRNRKQGTPQRRGGGGCVINLGRIKKRQDVDIKDKVLDVISKLEKLTDEELCEIWNTANNWGWDSRMGEEPENWSNLQLVGTREERSRNSYLGPINCYIHMVVSDKTLLRHHHIQNLHRTEKEFEKWWCAEVRQAIEQKVQ